MRVLGPETGVVTEAAADLRARARERLLGLRRPDPGVPDLCGAVRDVVVIASSSRGGSSVLAEILRHERRLLHFRAEVNLFLDLAGLAWPESGTGSDRLDAGHAASAGADLLGRLLAGDAGNPAADLPPEAEDAFASDLHFRLQAQWPCEVFDPERVREWMAATLDERRAEEGLVAPAFPDLQAFHAFFLARVRQAHPAVDPWYYDLPPDAVQRACPGLPPPQGPPGPVVLEEPPFVTVGPWIPATPESAARRPLVVKTPSNVHRIAFLRALFPRARLRILHLTRNAAAAVNGLYDGWRFRGFHAHRLPVPLAISGYTDHDPEGGAAWWKFDLPPGWEAWTSRPLVEVCGFQWREAHRAVLEADPGLDRHRMRFEDAVGAPGVRLAAWQALTRWIGIPLDADLARLVECGLPPIMATARPRHRRWFARADLLEPVLARPDTSSISEAIGYATDRADWT